MGHHDLGRMFQNGANKIIQNLYYTNHHDFKTSTTVGESLENSFSILFIV